MCSIEEALLISIKEDNIENFSKILNNKGIVDISIMYEICYIDKNMKWLDYLLYLYVEGKVKIEKNLIKKIYIECCKKIEEYLIIVIFTKYNIIYNNLDIVCEYKNGRVFELLYKIIAYNIGECFLICSKGGCTEIARYIMYDHLLGRFSVIGEIDCEVVFKSLILCSHHKNLDFIRFMIYWDIISENNILKAINVYKDLGYNLIVDYILSIEFRNKRIRMNEEGGYYMYYPKIRRFYTNYSCMNVRNKCIVCYETSNMLTCCNHSLCYSCTDTIYIIDKDELKCPMCRNINKAEELTMIELI